MDTPIVGSTSKKGEIEQLPTMSDEVLTAVRMMNYS